MTFEFESAFTTYIFCWNFFASEHP